MDISEDQSLRSVKEKLSKSKSVATSLHKIKHKISKSSSESTSKPRSDENSTKKTSNEKSDPKIKYKDQKKHRSVLHEKIIPDGIKLSYISKGKVLLTGSTKGNRIYCHCCKEVVSPTMFESHAGRTNSKKPYQHIFLESGISLFQYRSTKANAVKEGKVSGAVKDERVSGSDPDEQIAKQSIQCESSCDQIACVLCRSCDFSADGFNDQTSIVCDQCEKEYHVGCLKKDMNIFLKELPPDNWFCTDDCKSLHELIKLMVRLGPLRANDMYMEVVGSKLKGSEAASHIHSDVRWYVIKGKGAKEHCEQYKTLLTEAINIFHDCFNPIIDSVTGQDFIPAMAYGRQMGSSNFAGVYSALLTVNSKVITAGMFRILGREFAEFPFVATSQRYQGKGYFQVFMKCFDRLLSQCHIKKLLIHAAHNAKRMWIKKFGFEEVPLEMVARYRQTHTSMVAFEGTTLLQRDVPQGIVTSMHKKIIR